jgi:hypothetical protein
MVYPVFEESSIVTRCNADIEQFCGVFKNIETNIPISNDTGLSLKMDIADFDSMKGAIDEIMNYLNKGLENKSYVDEISHVSEEPIKQQLWIARTILFYQLLIFATTIMSNQTLYDSVMSNHSFKSELTTSEASPHKDKYPFKPEITEDRLKQFRMGIFGSITPTSDIDVGVQYIGDPLNFSGLTYVVACVESLFLIFTGKNSLDFDIEFYADMYLFPNGETDNIFYLHSDDFNEEQFKQMLPVVSKCIARNAIMAKSQDDFDTIITNFNAIKGASFNFLSEINMKSLSETAQYGEAKEEMKEFLTSSYDNQRLSYYESVAAAEIKKFQVASSIEAAKSLTLENRVELMILVANALAKRMESYVCAPTITHVVRILQASRDNPDKYKNIVPVAYCKTGDSNDPYCSIGKFGFVLSMLEQIAYVNRFNKTYCEGGLHPDEGKCAKKIGKYMPRFDDGFDHYKKHTQSGGKRRTKKRRYTKKQRKTNKKRKSKKQ